MARYMAELADSFRFGTLLEKFYILVPLLKICRVEDLQLVAAKCYEPYIWRHWNDNQSPDLRAMTTATPGTFELVVYYGVGICIICVYHSLCEVYWHSLYRYPVDWLS